MPFAHWWCIPVSASHSLSQASRRVFRAKSRQSSRPRYRQASRYAIAYIAFQFAYTVRSTNGVGRLARAARSFSSPLFRRASTRSIGQPVSFAISAGVLSAYRTFFAGLWCISPRSPISYRHARAVVSSSVQIARTSFRVQVKKSPSSPGPTSASWLA